MVYHSDVAFAPVSYLKMDLVLEEKDLPISASQEELLQIAGITSSPETFIQDVLCLKNKESEKGLEIAALKINKRNAAYAQNDLGWFEIRDVCGTGNSPKECVKNAFDALAESLEKHR